MILIILIVLNLFWIIAVLFLVSGLDNCDKFQIPKFDDTKDFQCSSRLLDVDGKQNRNDLQRNQHPALLPHNSVDMDTDV